MTKEEVGKLAESCGFTNHGFFDVKGLKFLEEVRQMCAADLCQSYDKNWSCPPACGSIADSKARAEKYDWGVALQVTGKMEDEFDVEAMMENEAKLKEYLKAFCEKIDDDILPMSAGTCGICANCTYPDAPCRFPGKMISSMEAYGLVVSEVCQLADIPYYYGPLTMTYTGCVLFGN